jgi:hypothetical protein
MSSTVRVACKLPAGLTVDHTPKGGEPAKFTLNGAASPGAFAGFGFTDVDGDLFKSWIENEGKDFAPVKHGMIFAMADERKAKDAAKERRGDRSVQTGAEPIDPTKPARGIEPTDAQKEELNKLVEEPGGQTVATA